MRDDDRHNDMTPVRWSPWCVYILLILCRILLCTRLSGYIHPDEFFQSGQELWFGCPPTIKPWEFEQGIRSIVLPPTLITKIPLTMLRWWMNDSLTGQDVLIVPRIICAVLSVVTVDGSIYYIIMRNSRRRQDGVKQPLLILASSWPCLVLLSRPFSNSLETMILSLLLAVVSSCFTSSRQNFILVCVVVGVLCAIGIFTRFTFCCFAFPIVLTFIREQTLACNTKSRAIWRLLHVTFHMGMGVVVTAAMFVWADSQYYQKGNVWDSITPWNAFLYNSNSDNLANHGLHPRWTHALVNMHLLYGPLAIVAYYTIMYPSFPGSKLHQLCTWIIGCGLGLLSVAPHQEPRFLLPLLVPLVILSHDVISSRRLLVGIWIVFNLILFVLFGVLHQGGVGSSLVQQRDAVVLYYHTYMPPTFLARQRQLQAAVADDTCPNHSDECAAISSTCPSYPIVDLKGGSRSELQAALNAHLDCSSSHNQMVHLVSPPLRDITDICHNNTYDCRLVDTFSPHLTTEDMPPFQGSFQEWICMFRLDEFEISCKSVIEAN